MSGDSSRQARQITVRGRVQGVWFRDSARREAQRLGVTGHAINLSNGAVEVFACGTQEALDALCDWLRQGPPLASVSSVEERPAEYQDRADFRIG